MKQYGFNGLLGLCLMMALFTGSAARADYTNSIGMVFKNIPAGSFIMGSCVQTEQDAFLGESDCANPDPEAFSNEAPQHRVRVKAFQMGQTEVTLGQFKHFLRAVGRHLVTNDFRNANSQGDNAAVSYVSWHDAQAFVQWLNKKEGGNHYRLPSEAEWEYAARAGTKTRYYWGNSANAAEDYAWSFKNARDSGQGYAHRVAQKKPNAWGLYDMSGNVSEWVQDCRHGNYQGAPADGRVWSGGDCGYRVQRGGSLDINARYLRSAFRSNISAAGSRYGADGFRLVRQP